MVPSGTPTSTPDAQLEEQASQNEDLESKDSKKPKTWPLETIQRDESSVLRDAGLGISLYDCPACGNTGIVLSWDSGGNLMGRNCECMAIRRSLRRIQKSGLQDLFQRYTFGAYSAPDESRQSIKALAMKFVQADAGWFYIGGTVGGGKSHICTAICGAMIHRMELRYIHWSEWSVQAKDCRNSPAYEDLIRPLTTVPLLYIDDLLHGHVTDSDKSLAFEIIAARYVNANLRTIISSELTIERLIKLDNAVGSRVYERARGFIAEPPEGNWRFRD